MLRSWQIHLITSYYFYFLPLGWNMLEPFNFTPRCRIQFCMLHVTPRYTPQKKCNHSGGSSAQTFAAWGLDLANCSDFELGQRLLILDRWDPWIAPHCLKNLPPFAVVVVKTASFGNQLSAMENTSGKQHVPMPEIFIAMLHCIVIQEVFGVFFVT